VNLEISMISLILNAGLIVQLVMLLLLGASVFSWAIIFARGQFLRRASEQLSLFEARFGQNVDFDKLLDYLSVKRETPSSIETIFRSGLREFLRLRKQIGDHPLVILEGAQRAMRTALAREEQFLEEHLPFLATVGSISVYVGLFGTVWGIMNAFRALGTAQQATLAMVAPGISEALIATAMGLFAAIPAVFAYNRFSHRVQTLIQSYDTLAEEFSGLLHRRIYAEAYAPTSLAPQAVGEVH